MCLCPGELAQGSRRRTPLAGGCQEVNAIQGLPAFRYRPTGGMARYLYVLQSGLGLALQREACSNVVLSDND